MKSAIQNVLFTNFLMHNIVWYMYQTTSICIYWSAIHVPVYYKFVHDIMLTVQNQHRFAILICTMEDV